jgi:hypothetical protein
MASRFILPFADVGSGIKPSSGARLFFYETGTNTFRNTFTDQAATTPNANPVIADSNGVFSNIFIDGTYKVILQNTNSTQIWEADPVVSLVSVSNEIKSLDNTTLIAASGLAIGDKLLCDRYAVSGEFIADLMYNIVAGGTGTADGGSFFDLDNDNQAQLSFGGGELEANRFGVSPNNADNITNLNAVRNFCEGKYGFILPYGVLNISLPWQVTQRTKFRGQGESTRITKTSTSVGVGSNIAPERPTVTDLYTVDAVIILEHEDNAFPFECEWSDFRVYGSAGTDSIGIYAPRMARSSLDNILCNDVEYGIVSFTSFTCGFNKVNTFDPSSVLIHGFDFRNDGSNGGTGTSNTFTSCYVNGASAEPFNFYGLNYCTLNSCAADSYGTGSSNVYAYRLESCQGMTMNSCGAELSLGGGYARLDNSTLVINSPKTFSLVAINGTANVLASTGSKAVINAPVFADFSSVTGTTYNFSTSGTSVEIIVNTGSFSDNATTFINGDVFYNVPQQNLISANNADASITINPDTNAGTQRFASTLTANRTVTLAGGWKGAKFRIARSAATPGTFTLAVGSLATISADLRGFVDVEHNGSSWVLTGFSEFT